MKLYTVIYLALFAMATVQVLIEFTGLAYWVGVAAILTLSLLKAALVAGYYQHLWFEPPAVSVVVLVGLVAALALTFAAAYSIM